MLVCLGQTFQPSHFEIVSAVSEKNGYLNISEFSDPRTFLIGTFHLRVQNFTMTGDI